MLLGDGDDAADSLRRGEAAHSQPSGRVIHDYHFMLSNLKSVSPFECRECGMRFIGPQQHTAHQTAHFETRLARHHSPLMPSHARSLSSEEGWTSAGEVSRPDEDFCLEVPLEEVGGR